MIRLWRRSTLVLLGLILFTAGCDDEHGNSRSTPTPTQTVTPSPIPTPTNTPVVMSGRLDLDIRWNAEVVLRASGDDLVATLTLNDEREVVAANAPLEGVGKVQAYPEADAILYTARFDAAPLTAGRCGSQPVALSLTLFRRQRGDAVSGGIAAYCGGDTQSGNPARMLRLSGSLPLTPIVP